MDLKSLQAQFSQFLYTRKPEKDSLQWISNAFNTSDKIESGLKVYRNNLLVTLADALGDTFPCIKQFLGNEFYNVTKDFIYSCPSENGDLNIYGSEFSTFLNNSSYQYKNILKNLAELEWLWEQCLYAKDDEALSKQDALKFIQSKGDDVRFKLRDSVLIFHDNYGVFPYWQEFRRNQKLETSIPTAISNEKNYLLWKDDSIRKVQEIENQHLIFVIALKNTKSLLEISNIEYYPETIIDCLILALERGWIKNCHKILDS